jgi:Fic family protein
VNIAEQELAHRPLSLSLIKSVHQRLMQGVRGRDKLPGSIRVDQNWIGRANAPIEKARFIPPNPTILPQALENWEAYLGRDDEDPILQVAVAHAQFEILHPFKDGNGRLGRMLIPLLLYQRGAISRPAFYLSEYLEARRETYYDRLLDITEGDDWQTWIEFFCEAVTAQAESNLSKVRMIRDLYDDLRKRVTDLTHSQYAMGAVDTLFAAPIIQAPQFAQRAGFNNRASANNMLRSLEGAGIISRLRDGSGRTPAIYVLRQLLDITEGRPIV